MFHVFINHHRIHTCESSVFLVAPKFYTNQASVTSQCKSTVLFMHRHAAMNSHKLKNDRKKGEAKSCIIHCLIAERLNISCVLIKQHTGLLFFCPFLCVNIDYMLITMMAKQDSHSLNIDHGSTSPD